MPYAVYANPFPVFQPAMRLITAITNAHVASVTTSFAHQYKTGTIIRFYIPPACGMIQLNQQTAPILVTGATTFTVPIDTTMYDSFSIPMPSDPSIDTASMVVPIGENNDILTAAVQNVLPYPAS